MKTLIIVNMTNIENLENITDIKDINIISTTPENFNKTIDSVFTAGDTPIFIKGLIETSDFMRLILARPDVYTKGTLLSHCGIVDERFIITDAALNMYPDAAAKVKITENAIWLYKQLHGESARPKVSVLTPAGKANPKIPSSVDAEFVREKLQNVADVVLDQLDTALSSEANAIKGRKGEEARPADILLCNDLDSGNILFKAFTMLGNYPIAGLIIGAKYPICLNSRADTKQSKMKSIEYAIRLSKGR